MQFSVQKLPGGIIIVEIIKDETAEPFTLSLTEAQARASITMIETALNLPPHFKLSLES